MLQPEAGEFCSRSLGAMWQNSAGAMDRCQGQTRGCHAGVCLVIMTSAWKLYTTYATVLKRIRPEQELQEQREKKIRIHLFFRISLFFHSSCSDCRWHIWTGWSGAGLALDDLLLPCNFSWSGLRNRFIYCKYIYYNSLKLAAVRLALGFWIFFTSIFGVDIPRNALGFVGWKFCVGL